jgi:superfamily II DNA or RNA helicase
MELAQLKPNAILRGPLFNEPVQVIAVVPLGGSVKIIGTGLKTGMTHQPILTPEQISTLEVSSEQKSYDGDSLRFRLGVEAMRLKIAYEYDPYFSLSIARVDPLPHQLEAVYDYFIKLPRVRFLLADDPGAGKTIMAGLLLKEMKIRGLVKRTLIVTPANLTFQWQREMKDKFREQFTIVRGDVLRANYGSNPWQDQNQVVTSVSWVSRVEDAKDSLLRSHWDLIIVDEAHKMSAYSADKKTLAYELGEHLSQMTDHYLLMTATPHKGDPAHFCLFLQLLDRDVYGDVKSLDEAMARNNAPFYLRRTKEALVSFPDPETGVVKKLFTKRRVDTVEFKIDADEWDFYDALTRYVEQQSIKASHANQTTGRAVGFTMAMLQRRFASSVYAVRRSLERMRDKRLRILEDPEAYRKDQIANKVPDDFDELEEEEQNQILSKLEDAVASVDPIALKEEIQDLNKLIDSARVLEEREIETKLVRLKEVISSQGLFTDKKMKLLVFTEHKDTLDYLVGKLQAWGLSVTQIHGGMKIGDRDTPGSRIYAEREFREDCQVLVATEAAGEGINLQFCWFMVNYDIPWNPIRLEQRMGRIHRYGQEKDCLILNFVSTNTREGRVLAKLFERLEQIEADIDPQSTGKVFNVLGDMFPANGLEKMVRDMYLHNETEASILARIVQEVDTTRFQQITNSTLEGLAKRELNLSAIVGKNAEAKERRLVPEVIENFFKDAGPVVGVTPKEIKDNSHIYRVGKVPRPLWPIGETLEPEFGRLAREYKNVAFDKEIVKKDATLDWVTPGHPLFESVRTAVEDAVRIDLERGSVFFDLHNADPYHLDVFCISIKDGRGSTLHRRLFVVQAYPDGRIEVRQPTIFLDLAVAPPAATSLSLSLVDRSVREQKLVEQALNPFLAEVTAETTKQVKTIRDHLQISLDELIHRQNMTLAKLHEDMAQFTETPNWLLASIKQAEDRIDELNGRLERRVEELAQEEQCSIGGVELVGSAWVLPHPDRLNPNIMPMVRDEEIERVAVEAVIAHENARGWVVESVEKDNRGFDLISRLLHPEDPKTAMQVRFIEVKGRAGVGEVALTGNEFHTAERLKTDYWLYVVYECGSKPTVHVVRDPARLSWTPIVRVEHYHIDGKSILAAEGQP